MPRLTKLYTRKGDDGTTGLASGQRISKDAPRMQVNGMIDELNTSIGVALAHGLCDRLQTTLPTIQDELFNLGCEIAFVEDEQNTFPLPRIEERHVEKLEALIDTFNEIVGPLENFILPGGSIGSASLHMARCVCRRAERYLVTLTAAEPINPSILHYINRLSDALFVMARYENKERNVAEPLWNTSI